ncbi:MAG TPA: 50S ribosomal protein L21 [Chloroflexi bacterium]|nr:50S ribosomal protein L21 [Chloroflexota bacterium]
MYAVVESGGKQYKVAVGQTVDVELLGVEEGGTVEFDRVLMVANDGDVRIGRPTVDGARVSATVVGHGRAPKVLVFKYQAKKRYRRKLGHRQGYTRLRIDEITV